MNDARLRMLYLRETLRLLWPPGSERLECEEFILVPGPWRPRLLVPRSAPHAAATAVRTHSRPAAWALGLGLLRHRIAVGDSGDSIDGYLSDMLDRHVVTAVYARPPRRVNRKPVLQVLSPEGELIAYAKVGHTELTKDLVRAERDTLKLLADVPLSVVAAPRVMHYGVWRGLDVLVVSPLIGGRRRVGRALLEAAAQEIHSVHPAGAWHGDFSPWNMARGTVGPTRGVKRSRAGGRERQDRLLLWDWERFAVGVPYGFDLLHHFLGRSMRRMPADLAARSCVEHAVRILPGVDEPRVVAAEYLAELARRDPRFMVDVEPWR